MKRHSAEDRDTVGRDLVEVQVSFGYDRYVMTVEKQALDTDSHLIAKARQKVLDEHDPSATFRCGSILGDDC